MLGSRSKAGLLGWPGLGALALVVATASACTKTSPPIAPVEVIVGAADAGPAASAARTIRPPSQGERCSARLVAGKIKTQAGCYLEERISRGNGLLSYPCRGDGPASATFADHRFEGTVSDGALSLTLLWESNQSDECLWESRQTLSGELQLEAKTRRPLAWTYAEHPVEGDACSGACSATAEIRIDDEARPNGAASLDPLRDRP